MPPGSTSFFATATWRLIAYQINPTVYQYLGCRNDGYGYLCEAYQ